ncbi:unnamed protein product [Caenorhabditis auriculariae]|uniref:DEP domain-containing protein n=1 Tax=Caenorhabditis auriculariae TaxID=2777116 RepID=A0A8S1GUN6_9PELO|nr:unnamed protein product [Caenorhabditis auriculariae]
METGYAMSQFPSTVFWNKLLQMFRDKMPTKRHRRNLKYIEESFTGSEAVTFLMGLLNTEFSERFKDRTIDRENCSNYLEILRKDGVICDSKKKDEPFRDANNIYIFAENGRSSSRRKLRRSASCSANHRSRTPPPPVPPREHESTEFNLKLEDIDAYASRKVVRSRRLSRSVGNIEVHINTAFEDSTESADFRRNKARSTMLIDELNEDRAKMDVKKQEKEKFYDWLPFQKRRQEANAKESRSKSLVRCSRRNSVRQQLELSEEETLGQQDVVDAWKDTLFSRFEALVGLVNNRNWKNDVREDDVEWNSSKVGPTGVVEPRVESEKRVFPSTIVNLMEYLLDFPFCMQNATVVKYTENQEKSIYKTLCSRFQDHLPGLTVAEKKVFVELLQRQAQLKAMMNARGVCVSAATSSSGPVLRSWSSSTPKETRTAPIIFDEEDYKIKDRKTSEALSLVLLGLPTIRRRKLHKLVKFMRSITSNHCLSLASTFPGVENNFQAVLRGLHPGVVASDGSPDEAASSILVAGVLLCNERVLFATPATFVDAVMSKLTPPSPLPGPSERRRRGTKLVKRFFGK